MNNASSKPTVLVIARDSGFLIGALAARCTDVEFVGGFSSEEVSGLLAAHDPEIVLSLKEGNSETRGHRLALDHPSVRWFHVAGSGYEHILPWDSARVTVSNSAGVLARYLAETVLAGMLMLSGNFPAYFRQQVRREWRILPFMPLHGRTLAVVGVGHIGAYVARYARALGMHVIGLTRAADAHPDVDEMLPLAELHTALGRADFVSIHLRLTPETEHLIDTAALANMRPGSYFINTSRGPVVDEPALVRALRTGHLGGAYLDVFETEPLPAQSPLWSMDNVIVTPHSADTVSDWRLHLAEFFSQNLNRWLSGEPLQNLVRMT